MLQNLPTTDSDTSIFPRQKELWELWIDGRLDMIVLGPPGFTRHSLDSHVEWTSTKIHKLVRPASINTTERYLPIRLDHHRDSSDDDSNEE